MFERIYTDITAETLDDEIFLIEADGGTARREDHNGIITLIAEFPGDPPPAELPTTASGFPWMAVAQAEMGVAEGDNPRITEYFTTTTLGAQPDSVPWCSAFVNFCVTRSGNAGTNSALARSWLNWGEESGDFVPGCIVVIARGGPSTGHVGFYAGRDPKGNLQLLGGNQHDSVNISSFPRAIVLGKRKLASAAAPPTGSVGLVSGSNDASFAARQKLINALIQVESQGNDNAIGDTHLTNKAFGCLQIRLPVCIDVNRRFSTNIAPEQMLGNRPLSIDTFEKYMLIWATRQRIGRAVTDQDRARIWNGGPNGFQRDSTLGYWDKVRQLLG
ncbi:MAG: TIGR02594 family protein [Alphaproteobacteria bacterium]